MKGARRVIRPAFPLLIVPLPFSWAGLTLACELAYREQSPSLELLTISILSGLSLLVVSLRWFRIRPLISLAVLSLGIFSLALSSGSVFWQTVSDAGTQAQKKGLQPTMQVLDDAHSGAISCYSLVRATLSSGEPVTLRLFWPNNQDPLPKGRWIEAQGTFLPLKEHQKWLYEQGISGSLSVGSVVDLGFEDSPFGTLDAFRADNVRRIKAIDTPGAALLGGVLLGNREAIDDTDLEQDFVSCGLTHLIAVSGSHLAVVATLCGWLFARLPLSKRSGFIILLFILITYVFLTGLQPSAIRSALMAAVSGVSFVLGRRAHAPSALAAAALLMLLVYPAHVFSLGFWLSVSAVLGITLFTGLIQEWLTAMCIGSPPLPQPAFSPPFAHAGKTYPKQSVPLVSSTTETVTKTGDVSLSAGITQALLGGIALSPASSSLGSDYLGAVLTIYEQDCQQSWQRRLGQIRSPLNALSVTLAATAATSPIALPVFAVLSLVSPLANLIVGPLVAVLLALGMFALCLSPFAGPLTNFLLLVASWGGELCAWLSAVLASVPYASVPLHLDKEPALIAALVVAALLYWWWPQASRGLARGLVVVVLAGCLVLSLIAPQFNPAQLVMMDVGQGDSLLVREGSEAVLIDTGASESSLTQALARNQVRELAAVIITHLDDDHCGALARLRGLVVVRAVYFARGLLSNQDNSQAVKDAINLVGASAVGELSAGDRLSLGEHIQLFAVWPQQEALEGSNQESLCLVLSYDANYDNQFEHQALLTGDAESAEVQAILDTYPQLRADIFKVGHHGSRDAVRAEQLQTLHARYALISAGANNRYGHPAQETLTALEQSACQIARTDQDGDVSLFFQGSELQIRYATIAPDYN
ncbi:MAG: ComEC/Rec2 family competence protein [Coriobacteriales bacterium]|jgi:competence protein ComEC|nr:ComEC/Rec2 family competence protein [Coriobacteriales bacterium]